MSISSLAEYFHQPTLGASERALQDTASGRFWHELRFDGTAIELAMWKVPLPFLKNEAPDLTFSVYCPPA